MKPGFHLLFLLVGCVLLSSCQKEFLDPDPVYDKDAQKFIYSAGITVLSQKTAIDDFVIQLKGSSLWSKFIAIYPMVGGTAETIKWNLKDPRDLDAAYRLTIYGSPVYDVTGVLFPTISDYADTHFIDNLFTYNNNAISYYSLTQNSVDGYDMGCIDYAPPYNELAIYESSDASEWFGYHAFGTTPANTKGLFLFSATTNDVKRYENSVVTDSKGSAPDNAFTGKPILVGKGEGAVTGGRRECGLATIGYGLTDQEVVTFYNIVKNFEAELGR